MKTILLIGLMTLSFSAYPDNFTSSPPCYKPNKPLMYSPAYYIKRYNEELIEYKQCIKDFIAKQELSIRLHKESIEQARVLLTQQKAISNAAFLSF